MLRLGLKLTHETLARRSGLSVNTIHKLEQGRRIAGRPATVHRLAKALGVPPQALLRGVDDEVGQLTSEELQLIAAYKQLGPRDKHILRTVLTGMLEPTA